MEDIKELKKVFWMLLKMTFQVAILFGSLALMGNIAEFVPAPYGAILTLVWLTCAVAWVFSLPDMIRKNNTTS